MVIPEVVLWAHNLAARAENRLPTRRPRGGPPADWRWSMVKLHGDPSPPHGGDELVRQRGGSAGHWSAGGGCFALARGWSGSGES